MSIQALDKFREKYPQYSNKSDEELASALATKYPDAYGDLPVQVSRSSAVSNEVPWYQEELPRMVGQIGGGIIGGVAGTPFGPAGTTLGAVGGAGIGRGLAEGIVQIGRGKAQAPLSRISDIGKEANIGMLGEMTGQIGTAALSGAVKYGNKALGSARQFLSGISDEAVAHGSKTGWRALALNSKESVEQAASLAADKVDEGIQGIRNYVSNLYGQATEKYADSTFSGGYNIMRNFVQNLKKSNLVYRSGDKIVKTKISGMDDLMNATKDIIAGFQRTGDRMTVAEAQAHIKVLNDIASNTTGSVKRAAINLANDIRLGGPVDPKAAIYPTRIGRATTEAAREGGIASVAPELTAVGKMYNQTEDTIQRASKVLMKEGEKRVMNPEKVKGFNKTVTWEQRRALEELNQLPGSNNFIDEVKDAALGNETYSMLPRSKTVSVMGGGVAGMRLMQGDPMMAGAIAAGLVASSPRLAALSYKYPQMFSKTLSNQVAKMIPKPLGQGLVDISERFGLVNRAAGVVGAEGQKLFDTEQ